MGSMVICIRIQKITHISNENVTIQNYEGTE